MIRTILTKHSLRQEEPMKYFMNILKIKMMQTTSSSLSQLVKDHYLKAFIMTFILLLNSSVVSAQGIFVTGKVSDPTGEPLIGVTIAEMNNDSRFINGSITDFNGNFSLKITDVNNALSFSLIGYSKVSIVPGAKRSLDVTLTEEAINIDEVTISAQRMVDDGEFNMDPRRITTAVTTVDFSEISDVQSPNIADQLQGRISGVDIVASSGEPGAGMSIRIRGTSSLNASSEPLIVINGIPFETSFDNAFDFSTADEEEYASLIGVSADDIKEISVLKDAAATAQFGSRGANGVLMITTKRGSKGKATFSAGYKGSISRQPDGMPMLNGQQYSTLMKDEILLSNSGVSNPEIEYDPSYELYNQYSAETDWLDEITQIGKVHTVNFGVSGGGEKAMYRISSSYTGETGTTVGTANTLFTTRAIMDYYVSDKLKISSELSYSHGLLDKSYKDGSDANTSIRNVALVKMPNMSIYELDEDGNSTGAYFAPEDNFQGSSSHYYNPVAMAELYTYSIKSNRISPNFRLKYKIFNNFTYDATVSFDANNNKTTFFKPEEALGTDWNSSASNYTKYEDNEFFVLRTENKFTWLPYLPEDHSLYTNLKFITYDKTTQSYGVKVSGAPSSDLQTPIIDARIVGSGNELYSSYTQYRQLTTSLAFNYAYKGRYILGGGLNYEGNSKFGDDSRFGLFPSVSAKWIMSDESFLQNASWIDELSIRSSYGVNGNAPSFNYGQYNVYSTYSYDYNDIRPAYPSSVELKGLKWETVTQKNIGANFRFLDGRFDIDMDIYSKRTEDMLSKNTSIPSSSGFSKLAYLNIGTIENKGWEFSVMSTLYQDKDFKVDFSVNLSQNENMIVSITDAMDVEEGNALTTGEEGYVRRIQEDNPIGSFYGYRYDGVYSTSEDLYARDADGNKIYDLDGSEKMMTFDNSKEFSAGDAKYEDVNHDGNINELDVVYLGNANTKLHGGFGPNISYKQFQLNVFFNFRYGQEVINLARMNTESMDSYDNQSTATLSRWRSEGDVTDVPRAYYNSPYNNLGSDRYLEDASFLRLKYVTFKYNLPRATLSQIGLSRASVYITAQNLLTFTKYTGPDPETGSSSDWQDIGFDTNQTPRSQQLTLGISASF